MPGPYYNAPGVAASDAIEQLVAQRAQLARQGVQDRLEFMKFVADQENANRALAEKRQEHQDLLDEKDKNSTLKIIETMQPGDIPDADTIARAKKYHIPLPMEAEHTVPVSQPSVVPEPPPGIAAPEQTSPAPMMEGMPARPPQGALRFAGTGKQRAMRDLAESFPVGSPERLSMDYIRSTGEQIPANLIKPNTDAPVFRQNAKEGKVERLMNGQWTTWGGDVPPGAHWMTEPQPRDTSASDAINADRDAARLDREREYAVSEFKDLTKSLEDSMIKYDRVETMLNQKTAQADADVAPLILGATVGGTGSGFRMTRAEIENTLKGRTKWEDLESTLNKWSTDPQHFTIPDSQREAMKALAKAIRAHGAGLHKKIVDMRYKVGDMKDPKQIFDARTELHDAMFPSEGSTAPAASGKSRVIYDQNGQVVK